MTTKLPEGMSVETARRLIQTPTTALSDDDIRAKGELLARNIYEIDDLNLDYPTKRSLLGIVKEGTFIPYLQDLQVLSIPSDMLPTTTEKAVFVEVPVSRDGYPSGDMISLKITDFPASMFTRG